MVIDQVSVRFSEIKKQSAKILFLNLLGAVGTVGSCFWRALIETLAAGVVVEVVRVAEIEEGFCPDLAYSEWVTARSEVRAFAVTPRVEHLLLPNQRKRLVL